MRLFRRKPKRYGLVTGRVRETYRGVPATAWYDIQVRVEILETLPDGRYRVKPVSVSGCPEHLQDEAKNFVHEYEPASAVELLP